MLFANFLLFATIYSQEQVYIPNTPEASLITRYGDYPVDMSTGLPSIEIPLFSLPTRSKDISMNLGLSYHQSSIDNRQCLSPNHPTLLQKSFANELRQQLDQPIQTCSRP